MIASVRLMKATPLGKDSLPLEHFTAGRTSVDGVAVSVTFDKDDRYLRFNYTGKTYFDLIPFHNVASLHVIPDVNKPAAKE